PPLCMVSAAYGLRQFESRRNLVAAALVLVFCIKAGAASQPWGLPFGQSQNVSSARWFRWYAEQRRANELIAVNSDDEYYATALPIAKIRYCYLDPNQIVRSYAPRYAFLGITVSAAQFENIDQLEPEFRARLRRWGLASSE